ncbi:hypothetical protein OC842_006767 [Tilletia horrida]|uniref:IMS import disulfide relay-system CHCH-CHCH-like Cx9C domain-containing protein n=1 Tax=Tilletia horrida TaxID=155126 RepID=A0AAN6JHM4_9BASI|nr:hypothetical protein OC842_006767 [Tilletia horrida]KAK0548542.1 hypothetical protein OC844_007012 [Tilletia horrida]
MSSAASKVRDLQPLVRLGKAAGECSIQAQAYGACMLAGYQNAEKGMCQREFVAFKACVQSKMGRKW